MNVRRPPATLVGMSPEPPEPATERLAASRPGDGDGDFLATENFSGAARCRGRDVARDNAGVAGANRRGGRGAGHADFREASRRGPPAPGWRPPRGRSDRADRADGPRPCVPRDAPGAEWSRRAGASDAPPRLPSRPGAEAAVRGLRPARVRGPVRVPVRLPPRRARRVRVRRLPRRTGSGAATGSGARSGSGAFVAMTTVFVSRPGTTVAVAGGGGGGGSSTGGAGGASAAAFGVQTIRDVRTDDVRLPVFETGRTPSSLRSPRIARAREPPSR
jgi:hypothetical protein